MHKSEASVNGAEAGSPVQEEQILALVGSQAPEDVRAAAADALITTDVQLDRRMILPTVALTFTYLAQQMILITYGSILGYINADVGPFKTYTWMAASWSMACAIFLPIAGPLGDILGRRYFFIAGNTIGIIAGIVAATAQSVQVVVVGTTLSGMAAAFQQLAIAAASEIYPNKYRGFVQALLENVPMAFNAAGSLIAHRLVETRNWRYVFYIYVIFCGCAMIFTALFYHPPLPHKEQTRLQLAKNIDWIGAGIWMAGLTSFLLGISWAGGQFAWKSVAVILPMILGVLLLVGLGFWEVLVSKSSKNPIFPPHIFKNVRGFTNLLVTVTILSMPLYAMASVWPAEIGAIFTSDPIKIGVYGLPWGIGSSFGSLMTGLLLHYVPRVNWLFTALVALQAIFISLLATITPSSIKPALAFSFLGGAANLGAQLTGIVMVQFSTGDRNIGLATGLLACARSVGGAIAVSIYNTIVQSRMQIEWPKRLAEATLPLGLPESSLPLLLGALASGNQTAIASVPGVDPEILAAAAEATRYSFAASFRVVFYLVAGLGSLAVVLAATTRDISQFMTRHVAVDLNKGKHPRIADKAAGQVEHVEGKES
ncbi:hypothetical protein BHE90_015270 [Fusarium euwallaceae]|uniref:Major facilitator superfamily (MFS) profile domain-containing protein n=1 Tax=Fusarium euwallaceae TaxID=1147111 RepID=A0A430L3U7_9HYPO|nr:hypothetical protein BHE90_015270 [Fusarium euwallaceae]